MSTTNYEVIDGPLTVHRDVRQLRNPLTNEPVGFQRGAGKICHVGDVLAADEVASIFREALDDKNHELHDVVSQKLKKVSDDPSENLEAHLGLPFEGYDDMDPEEIVQAMRVLPSATVQRIKQYEASKEGRSEIVDYNIGFGEHPDARQTMELDVPEPDENKEVRKIKTREVPESGPVQHGEGITGTGEPAVIPGTANAEAEEDDDDSSDSGRKSARAPKARAGRRARSAPKAKASGNDSDDENK